MKQNKALLPVLIIAGVTILMAIIIAIANIRMARQTNQNLKSMGLLFGTDLKFKTAMICTCNIKES